MKEIDKERIQRYCFQIIMLKKIKDKEILTESECIRVKDYIKDKYNDLFVYCPLNLK